MSTRRGSGFFEDDDNGRDYENLGRNRSPRREPTAWEEFMEDPSAETLGAVVSDFSKGSFGKVFTAFLGLFRGSSGEDSAIGGDGKPPSKIRGFIRWTLRLTIGFVLFALIVRVTCFVYVEPNEFGIKTIRVGMKRGVQKEVLTCGYHLAIPFMAYIQTLPQDLQVLELTNNPETAAKDVRTEKAAHIQTSDGFFVDADVSFVYEIFDPYLVFTQIGPGALYEDNGIIPKAEPALKDTLGKLSTEDFYNSALRVARAEETKKNLNVDLLPKGLRVKEALVRYFKYSPEIQKNIEQKKLQDQLVFTNQSKARAATEEALIKKITQEGLMIAAVEIEKGKAYVTRKKADRDLYVRTKKADADLLVKLAEAERTRLKNSALEGLGADRMVGIKMANVLKGLETIVLPSDGEKGVNPLDLDGLLNFFKGKERK